MVLPFPEEALFAFAAFKAFCVDPARLEFGDERLRKVVPNDRDDVLLLRKLTRAEADIRGGATYDFTRRSEWGLDGIKGHGTNGY